MEQVAVLGLTAVLAYFCVMLAYRRPPPIRRLVEEKLLNSEGVRRAFEAFGVRWKVRVYQSVRYLTAAGWIVYAYGSALMTGEKLTTGPLLAAALIVALTSTIPFSPVWWFFRWKKRREELERDGELIAFVRLFEMGRGRTSLPVFCVQVSGYFSALRTDLLELSRRLTAEGQDRAFAWFESRFPKRHEYIHHVTLLLRQPQETREVSGFLEKLSRSHFERRWKLIGPWLSVMNVVPSFVVMVMVVMLVVQYVTIVKNQIS